MGGERMMKNPPQSRSLYAQEKLIPTGLAPMEGVSDFATRLWFSLLFPPPFMSTPFWRVTGHQQNPLPSPFFAPELNRAKDLVPYRLVPQIMAESPEAFCRGAETILKETATVDLNAGCPSPTVTGKGAGSSLLAQKAEFKKFIHSICHSLGAQHISLKMRTGYGKDPDDFLALIESIAEYPLARLTVHGRTRVQRYTGKASWDLIAHAAEKVPVPVYGSGDIMDRRTYNLKVSEAPGIAGVIIGRGALRNPWLFYELSKGEVVNVSLTTLIHALTCYALLRTLLWQNPEKLLELADQGFFLNPCTIEEEKWRQAQAVLSYHVFGKELKPTETLFEKKIFSSIKMLWSYLRSSLPLPFYAPTPLRSTNFSDFISALASFDRECYDAGHQLSGGYPLIYNPNCDWVYAGERNPNNHDATTIPN